MAQIYNDPINGADSTIGTQLRTDLYQKKALVEARKKQFFTQLADVTSMPKHMGKKIKKYHYVPMLDDANINDQGIDAAGVSTTQSVTIVITPPGADGHWHKVYAEGEGATAAAALTAAKVTAVKRFKELGVYETSYATTKTALLATGEWAVDDTGAAVPAYGNLYGSSKDVGTITSKLPALSENGGRVNRVGFRRVELEGTIERMGFFDEYTDESLMFDTDAELLTHINREMVSGAVEMAEDIIQIDLLNGAGVIRYGGAATATNEVTGEGGDISLVTYNDLMRLSIDLDNNRCDKHTKIITGTRNVDTKVVDAARVMFVGSELIPQLKNMVDGFGNQAFVPAAQYAAGTTLLTGEIGSIDQFRFVVVPEMMHWEGAGASATAANAGYRETGGKYDVFPMLVVGNEAFTTIGFQTDGKSTKFNIIHKKPGKEIADHTNPYGTKGFMSIQFWTGSMILRSERIAVVKTVAAW